MPNVQEEIAEPRRPRELRAPSHAVDERSALRKARYRPILLFDQYFRSGRQSNSLAKSMRGEVYHLVSRIGFYMTNLLNLKAYWGLYRKI